MHICARLAVAALALTLAACVSGEPNGFPNALLSHQGKRLAEAARTTASFVLSDDRTTTIDATVHPKYVSASTRFIAVALGSQVTTQACDTSQLYYKCTVVVEAPAGTNTFAVSALDANNTVLSTASVAVDLKSGKNTFVHCTLDGIVASLAMSLAGALVLDGKPSATSLIVTPRDADGNVIVGKGEYESPIHLTSSDHSGATTLEPDTLSKPAAYATLTYDGRSLVDATITASAATLGKDQPPPAPLIFTPTLDASAYHVPIRNKSYTPLPSAVGKGTSLWFAQFRAIGKMTAGGRITEHPLPADFDTPGSLVLGSDESVWFNQEAPDAPRAKTGIMRLLPNGQFRIYRVNSLTNNTGPLMPGPGGTFWFFANNFINRMDQKGDVVPVIALGRFQLEQFDDSVASTDGQLWIVAFGALGKTHLIKCSFANRCTEYPAIDWAQNYATLGAGPNGAVILATQYDAGEFSSDGKQLWHADVGPTFSLSGEIAAVGNSVFIPGSRPYTGLPPLILHFDPNGNHVALSLPANPGQEYGLQALLPGPNGSLFYTAGYSVGSIDLHWLR